MYRMLFLTIVAALAASCYESSAIGADRLGHARLAGLPAPRVVVDFDLDEASEGAFIRSETQFRDRIVRVLGDHGLSVTNDADSPKIDCSLKVRLLPLSQGSTATFAYRLETSVLDEVALVRTPTKTFVSEIWRKADFGFAIQNSLVDIIEAQLDRQVERLARDWTGP